MNNRRYFPYERSNYYAGKLLTSRELEAEQRYMNDKRRLMNRLTQGQGILAGLGVLAADDSSLAVQAGCALDASGREIVVPQTLVLKLASIEGFDELEGDSAWLTLGYDEALDEEVYAAMAEGTESSHNKVREGYRFALKDTDALAAPAGTLKDFLTSSILFEDKGVRITQRVPRYAQPGSDLAVEIEMVKTSAGISEYSLKYTLETPGFAGPGGEERTVIDIAAVELTRGGRAVYTYRFVPAPQIWGGTDITFTATDITLSADGEASAAEGKLTSAVVPLSTTADKRFISEWYAKPMDKHLSDSYDEPLVLARIDLFRKDDEVAIDRVWEPANAQLSYNAQQLAALRQLEGYYPQPLQQSSGEVRPMRTTATPATADDLAKNTACGSFDLGLGMDYSTREPVFSAEMMHGLGTGPVYVQVGLEYLDTSENTIGVNEMYFGVMRLFDDAADNKQRLLDVDLAVKVLPDRGTFQVAVLPKKSSSVISVRIRWFAYRASEVNRQIKAPDSTRRAILLNPDTIVVPPKGSAAFTPVFIGMEQEACRFTMVDKQGGSITNNGVYTAPAKEGVYEIRVEAVSDASVAASAFAVVSADRQDEAANAHTKKK
jgi:hypothetical protein